MRFLPSRNQLNARSRRALTLIELLVIVSVFAVLAGLLVPAVQSAREASRRIQCVANLRQLGIAMNSYYSIHDMFTPSRLLTGRKFSSNDISEHVFLLPYIDQIALFNSINMAFSQRESIVSPNVANRTVRHTVLSVYLCPSDGEPNHRNSYRFNMGRLGAKGPGTGFDGPFNIKVLPSDAAVRDGLSQTAFVSERIAGSFRLGAKDSERDYKHPIESGTIYRTDSDFIAHCEQAELNEWGHRAGRFWFFASLSDTRYNHNGSPNDPRPSCTAFMSHDNGFGLNPPRSYHWGVVNVLFGDGRVEPVANSINPRVWIALGTHASGD